MQAEGAGARVPRPRPDCAANPRALGTVVAAQVQVVGPHDPAEPRGAVALRGHRRWEVGAGRSTRLG